MEQIEVKEKLGKLSKELFELAIASRDVYNMEIQNRFGEIYLKSKELYEYLKS